MRSRNYKKSKGANELCQVSCYYWIHEKQPNYVFVGDLFWFGLFCFFLQLLVLLLPFPNSQEIIKQVKNNLLALSIDECPQPMSVY